MFMLNPSRARRGIRIAATTLLAVVACSDGDPAGPGDQDPLDGSLPNLASYVVQVEPGVDPARLADDHGVRPERLFLASFDGFSALLSETLRFSLIEDPRVLRVEPDERVETAGGEQILPDWGLDRLDQRGNTLDGIWRYDYMGLGTTVYVVDTGVRTSHSEFSGRARTGFDVFGAGGEDCNGHGTHVAASIAGTRFGVVKSAAVVSVRVLDCEGNGRVSDVIAGLDWILATHPTGSAVVNLSFGGTQSVALDAAVRRVLDSGLLVVTSAGNSGADACLYSPARVDGVLTVAASDRWDRRPDFSNVGPCVDLFAPGVDIRSAHHRSDTDEAVFTGTSSAAPFAAGVALMALERSPGLSPSELHSQVWRLATRDVVGSADSPNPHLLFAPQLPQRSDPPPPLPPPPPPVGTPMGLNAVADARMVRIQVAWAPSPADEIEIEWRPEHGAWRSDRLRKSGIRTTLKHPRSSTRYEIRMRSRTRAHGGWILSEWSPSVSTRTCARKGKSALCA